MMDHRNDRGRDRGETIGIDGPEYQPVEDDHLIRRHRPQGGKGGVHVRCGWLWKPVGQFQMRGRASDFIEDTQNGRFIDEPTRASVFVTRNCKDGFHRFTCSLA